MNYKYYIIILIFIIICPIIVFAEASEIKWTYKTDYGISSPPAIGLDGTVYFVDRKTLTTTPTFTYGSNLYALNPDGTLKWKLKHENEYYYYHSPAIGPDGTVYIFDYTTLVALTPDGKIKWKFTSEAYYLAIGNDGILYISGDSYLGALTPEGILKWKYTEIGGISHHIIGLDGTIYVAKNEGSLLYAFNPNGTLKWKSECRENYELAVGIDGTIYAGGGYDKPDMLFSYRIDGTIKWKINYKFSYLLVSKDESIYTSAGTLNPDGTTKSDIKISENSIIGSDGKIYSNPGKTVLSSDGTLYYGDSVGNIVAIQTDLKGYQEGAPWPCKSHDARNTFCADSTVYHSVSGILLHDGKPTPNIRIKIGENFATSDEQGKYSIFLKDGTYPVSTNSNLNITDISVSGSDIVQNINLPKMEGNLKWKFSVYSGTVFSPAIGPDGTIYINDFFFKNEGFERGSYFFAINSDGTIKWRNLMYKRYINHISSVGNNGFVFTMSSEIPAFDNHDLFVYNSEGKFQWNQLNNSEVKVAHGNDEIYLTNLSRYTGGSINILNPDGSLKLEIKTPADQPFIGSDSSVYFNNNNGVNRLLPDGTIKNIGSGGNILAIGKKDIIYTSSGTFRALNSDGSLLWDYPIPGVQECVVNNEGVVYAANNSEYLYAINSDGSLQWKYTDSNAGKNLIKSLCVGADGVVYFVNTINSVSYLYAVNQDGSFRWKFKTEKTVPDKIYPMLDKNGALYIIDSGRTLYSIQTSSYGYQKGSPWPCYGHDNGHTFNSGTVFTAVEDDAQENTPAEFRLLQNYPNPFNPQTTIAFTLSKPGKAEISVYNLQGQKIVVLNDGYMPAGNHSVVWNAKGFASGVYFVRVKSGESVKTEKMLFVK